MTLISIFPRAPLALDREPSKWFLLHPPIPLSTSRPRPRRRRTGTTRLPLRPDLKSKTLDIKTSSRKALSRSTILETMSKSTGLKSLKRSTKTIIKTNQPKLSPMHKHLPELSLPGRAVCSKLHAYSRPAFPSDDGAEDNSRRYQNPENAVVEPISNEELLEGLAEMRLQREKKRAELGLSPGGPRSPLSPTGPGGQRDNGYGNRNVSGRSGGDNDDAWGQGGGGGDQGWGNGGGDDSWVSDRLSPIFANV